MLKDFSRCLRLLLILGAGSSLWFAPYATGQSDAAVVLGRVVDQSGMSVDGAQVELVDIDRDNTITAKTQTTGFYSFLNVKPGHYRMQVSASGFRTINLTSLTINIQDNLEENFKLAVGSVSESVTVEAKSG